MTEHLGEPHDAGDKSCRPQNPSLEVLDLGPGSAPNDRRARAETSPSLSGEDLDRLRADIDAIRRHSYVNYSSPSCNFTTEQVERLLDHIDAQARAALPVEVGSPVGELIATAEAAERHLSRQNFDIPPSREERTDIAQTIRRLVSALRSQNQGLSLCNSNPAAAEASRPANGEPSAAWRPIETAPLDGSDVLLFHRIHGPIAGRFCPGEWSDDTPISPREYSGAVWVLGDDIQQEEVEEGPEGSHHGSITHWMPLPDAPSPSLGVGEDVPSKGGAA